MDEKLILDICCGLRAMWFNKNHPNVVYNDHRNKPPGFDDFRPNFSIQGDIQHDWGSLPFDDETFNLVVFDPPHIFSKPDQYRMIKYYGNLDKETWREDLKRGFDEAWRVLKKHGVLIFKWSEVSVKKKDVLKLFDKQPLFGHPNGSRVPCHWLCFMKGLDE